MFVEATSMPSNFHQPSQWTPSRPSVLNGWRRTSSSLTTYMLITSPFVHSITDRTDFSAPWTQLVHLSSPARGLNSACVRPVYKATKYHSFQSNLDLNHKHTTVWYSVYLSFHFVLWYRFTWNKCHSTRIGCRLFDFKLLMQSHRHCIRKENKFEKGKNTREGCPMPRRERERLFHSPRKVIGTPSHSTFNQERLMTILEGRKPITQHLTHALSSLLQHQFRVCDVVSDMWIRWVRKLLFHWTLLLLLLPRVINWSLSEKKSSSHQSMATRGRKEEEKEKKKTRFYRDSNSDCWIQSPKC